MTAAQCASMPKITPPPSRPTSAPDSALRGGMELENKLPFWLPWRASLVLTTGASTVSKVLRNKDKYLNSEDRSSSPVKRNKGKGADLDKTLANFLRKALESGVAVTSEDLKEKARLFSAMTGGEPLLKTNSSAWLDKFMLKHGIGPGRLMRRASETNIPDSIRNNSPSLTPSQPSSAISPASPSGHLSPSPLSANKSDEEKGNATNLMDLTPDGAYKPSNSQGTTSLSSSFTDAATPSFPGSALSPAASFNFSPDPNTGGFTPGDQGRPIPPHGTSPGFQRPRSQTFPTLDLECLNQPQPSEPVTPKYHVSSTAPSSALEPPVGEPPVPNFSLDQAVSPPQLRHCSSSSSIAGRSTTTPVTASAVGSSPGSPTQEDARRAADTLLSFITNASGFVDQNEYLTVVRLTEKLRLHQSQLAKAAHAIGGLSRIPEGDSEMPNAPPSVVKMEQTMSA